MGIVNKLGRIMGIQTLFYTSSCIVFLPLEKVEIIWGSIVCLKEAIQYLAYSLLPFCSLLASVPTPWLVNCINVNFIKNKNKKWPIYCICMPENNNIARIYRKIWYDIILHYIHSKLWKQMENSCSSVDSRNLGSCRGSFWGQALDEGHQ